MTGSSDSLCAGLNQKGYSIGMGKSSGPDSREAAMGWRHLPHRGFGFDFRFWQRSTV